MYIFRNNSIHFLINFIATGTAGLRFPRRYGLFFPSEMLELWSGWVCSFSITLLITLGNMLHSDWVMTSPCGCGLIIWVSFLKLLPCFFFFFHRIFHCDRPGLLEAAGPGGGSANTGDPGVRTMSSSCLPRPGRPPSQMGGPLILSLQICSGTSTRKVKTLVLEDGTAFTTWVRRSLRAARVWGARDTNEKTWTLESKTEEVSVAKATYNLHMQTCIVSILTETFTVVWSSSQRAAYPRGLASMRVFWVSSPSLSNSYLQRWRGEW